MFQNVFVRRDGEHDHYTRASGNLSVQYTRTNYRRLYLFCKGPIFWNEIPSNSSSDFLGISSSEEQHSSKNVAKPASLFGSGDILRHLNLG